MTVIKCFQSRKQYHQRDAYQGTLATLKAFLCLVKSYHVVASEVIVSSWYLFLVPVKNMRGLIEFYPRDLQNQMFFRLEVTSQSERLSSSWMNSVLKMLQLT